MTPKDLVQRCVAMARMDRRIARRKAPSVARELRNGAVHMMKLARHIKRAALTFKSY